MDEKLTPRQIAGRLNQRKSRGITEKGKEKLRQAALRNKPWQFSTGPRTEAGKLRSRVNALKNGKYAYTALPEELKVLLCQSLRFRRRRH